MSASAQLKHSRSRTACRQCRQAKVKCGMETTPCSRCKRRGFDCQWDPGFKRSNNPDRFHHLEGHLRMLEQKLEDPATHRRSLSHPNTVPHVSPDSEERTTVSKRSIDVTRDEHPSQMPGNHSTEESMTDLSHFRALNIKLTRQDADELFAQYVVHKALLTSLILS